jgi:hypothetical protein
MSSELKARRMLRDRALHIREYFPQGPKVFHFAENLAGCETAVTVDTHAMQAALSDVLASYRLAWRPYLVFAGAYMRASERCKVSPATFQAIIWHVWKRKHPRASKLNARKQWVVIATEDE